MGSYLITATMNRRHELSMQSYDRLFPNQDTMPRGGFGNLIALPLQYEPRQHGNSVFIDEQFEPFPDQWAFLASVPRVDPALATKIAQEAIRTDQVVGVRFSELTDDHEDSTPWTTPPSKRDSAVPISGPLPSAVRAVLSQRLYIEKQGLPASLLNRLKRLAAFQNPEFYKKQRMRLSTAMTPRVIHMRRRACPVHLIATRLHTRSRTTPSRARHHAQAGRRTSTGHSTGCEI
jgi:hypothetical protein